MTSTEESDCNPLTPSDLRREALDFVLVTVISTFTLEMSEISSYTSSQKLLVVLSHCLSSSIASAPTSVVVNPATVSGPTMLNVGEEDSVSTVGTGVIGGLVSTTGLAVGSSGISSTTGLSVGLSVGGLEGEAVPTTGAREGPSVGVPDGEREGATVGSAVVGEVVGPSVGAVVGEVVGLSVGG